MRLAVAVHDPGALAHAGAVDHRAQRPGRHRPAGRCLGIGLAGDVGPHQGPGPGAGELLPRLLVGVHQHEFRAGRVRALGGRPAQTGSGAGDQRGRLVDAHRAWPAYWCT